MDLHPWWSAFGATVTDYDRLPLSARQLLGHIGDDTPGVSLVAVRNVPDHAFVAIHLEVEVERPQLLTHPIRAREPIAICYAKDQSHHPSILALRADFPETPHQNGTPSDSPSALCVDDRPWSEARLTTTASDLIRRIRLWLAKAATGDLHDTARPPDPMFFPAPRTLVIPRSALQPSPTKPIELVGFVNAEDKRVIIALPLDQLGGRVPDQGRLAVIVLKANAQPMTRMKHPPVSIADLASVLDVCGIDLNSALKVVTAEWAGVKGDNLRRLASAIAILVAFPVAGPEGKAQDDLRAFVTADTAGEIGVALGSLLRNDSDIGAKTGYLKTLAGSAPAHPKPLLLEPCDVNLAFDPQLGAAIAGIAPDARQIMLIGAGSIGSQLALNLAREGTSAWTIVDHDRMLPHNLARHGLTTPAVIGMPKAAALAAALAELTGAPATPIVGDAAEPGEAVRQKLDHAFSSASLILDTSASVATARSLSDLPHPARRASAFFNPAGTAVVLLVEAQDRGITLRDLEAKYHQLVQTTPELRGHLAVSQTGLRYSGSCRALSNRISASNAALLSAIASRALRIAIAKPEAAIEIWSVADDGGVRLTSMTATPVTRVRIANWELAYDAALLANLAGLRQQALPHETGGVLLGIADMSRHALHLVTALGPPPDSVGSPDGFERGTEGLLAAITTAAQTSQHQIRYVGEWHSHPRRASAVPSPTDLTQLAWLRRELATEGLPALMAIAADNGQFSFCLSDAGGRGA